MDDFQRFLTQDIGFQQALSGFRGEGPEAGLQRAAAAQTLDAQQQEMARAEKVRETFANIGANGMDMNTVNEIMRVDPNTGLKLLEMVQKQQRAAQKQQLLGEIFKDGFGGGNATKVAAAGVATGDTSLLPLATFMQAQENRTQDEANRIAAEDRKAGKEAQKAVIPGYEVMEGVSIDPATARGARELNSAIPTYQNAVEKIKLLIDKHGSTTGIGGTDVNDMNSAFGDLMNAERAVNNTGVLNVGEKPILEELYSNFDPRNKWNLTKSNQELKKAADSYLNDRISLIQGKLGSIGYIAKNNNIQPEINAIQSNKIDINSMSLEQLKSLRASMAGK